VRKIDHSKIKRDLRQDILERVARRLGKTTQQVLNEMAMAKVEFVAMLDAIKSGLCGRNKDMAIMAAHAWYKGYTASLSCEYFVASHLKPNDKKKPGRKRRHPDTVFYARRRIRSTASSVMHAALKKGKRKEEFELLFGYPCEKLKAKLKKKIPDGYCWDDYLTGSLHIDHIVPIRAFNYADANHFDFLRAWNWKNLQLLPASDNLRKSDKMDFPFQPSLGF
jgi:hypothetical protein